MYTYAVKLTSVTYRRRRQIAFTRLTLLFTQFNSALQLRKLYLVLAFVSRAFVSRKEKKLLIHYAQAIVWYENAGN